MIRQTLLTRLEQYTGGKLVRVLVGQRRAGKSYLLRQWIDHLLDQGVPPRNIFYFNKESVDYADITNYRQLDEIIGMYRTSLGVEGRVHLLLDEVQEVAGWENLVNSYAQDPDSPFEIVVTGSNSKMLSSELSTLLSGRHIPFEILPFSFPEFCRAHAREGDKAAFLSYMGQGGLPELVHLPTEETRRHYVAALRDSILLNDIVHRHGVKDVALLQGIFRFVCDSIGSLFSVNSLVAFLRAHGVRTNHETVSNYLDHLCEALIVHRCDRHDLRGKQILAGNCKYYLNDLAFREYLTSGFDPGLSRRLENAVYLHFRSQGYEVSVGAGRGTEVDFIVEKGTERAYFQVCYSLGDESVAEREFRGLETIRDNHPKTVLSLDDASFGQRKGIGHRLAWQVLAPER